MSRYPLILAAGVAAVLAFSDRAAAQVVTFGGTADRKQSIVMFFDKAAGKYLGSYSVTHGTPPWKSDYEKHVGTTDSFLVRLGNNAWTTFHTSVPMTIADQKIKPGTYNLALGGGEGKYFLALLDSRQCDKQSVPPWQPKLCTKKIMVPLNYTKVDAAANALSITVTANKDDVSKGELKLHWGNHQLSAAVHADHSAKPASDASAKKKKSKRKKQEKADK
ncbi:MAG: DUF2911 domain-containing protein [Planctomycetes bacterium]|nr:DUF2911 domain-containing protein [Planctomycetota bacterium]